MNDFERRSRKARIWHSIYVSSFSVFIVLVLILLIKSFLALDDCTIIVLWFIFFSGLLVLFSLDTLYDDEDVEENVKENSKKNVKVLESLPYDWESVDFLDTNCIDNFFHSENVRRVLVKKHDEENIDVLFVFEPMEGWSNAWSWKTTFSLNEAGKFLDLSKFHVTLNSNVLS